MVILTRRRFRSIAIDVYNVPREASLASSEESPAPASTPATVLIAQAQTVVFSAPQPSPQPDSNTVAYTLHVLAAMPYALNHHSLIIPPTPWSTPPELQLELLGDDSTARAVPVIRRPSQPHAPDSTENDDYDSDSTLSRVAQPSQVLDLQIGPTGRRAVAIQVAAHSNDRTIWAYTLPEGEGDLIARKLKFGNKVDRILDNSVKSTLKAHACRADLDEVTGAVVIAADCEEVFAFQY